VPGWSSPIGHPIRREVTYCRNHPPALFWDSSNEGVGLLSLADAMASSSPSAVHLLHKAAQLADALFVRNVTPRQFEILKAAAAVDGLSQTAIMTTTGIDRSSTGPLVSKLVRMGLCNVAALGSTSNIFHPADPTRAQPVGTGVGARPQG
jgi:hypothetical protein